MPLTRRVLASAIPFAVAVLVCIVWTVSTRAPADPPARDVVRSAAAPAPGDAGPAPGAATPQDTPPAAGFATPRASAVVSAPAPVLRGRLVRAGEPVQGITVRVLDDWRRRTGVDGASAADGSFAVPVRLPDRRCFLEISGGGVPQRIERGPIAMTMAEVDLGAIEIPVAASVAGRVVDELGVPIVGVRVTARTSVDEYVDPDSDALPAVVTGADGAFRIVDLLPGDMGVAADHPDHYRETRHAAALPGRTVDVGAISLRAAAPLRGDVVDTEGRPIAAAQVTGLGYDNQPWRHRTATTAADGSFVLRGCDGWPAILVRAAGHTTAVVDCGERERRERQQKPERVHCVLAPELVLRGTVAGNDGRGGHVRVATPADAPAPLPWIRELLEQSWPMEASGAFAIAGLPPGRWVLRAEVPGRGSSPSTAVELPQQEPARLVLTPDRVVDVEVVDPDGAPVSFASVCRVPGEGDTPAIVDPGYTARAWIRDFRRILSVTDDAGRVQVAVPGGEALQLAAVDAAGRATAVAFACDAVPSQVTLRLPPGGGMIRGRIDGGERLAAFRRHARLCLWWRPMQSGEAPTQAVDVDVDGRFAFAPGCERVRLVACVEDLTSHADGKPSEAAEPIPLIVAADRFARAVEVVVPASGEVDAVVPMPVLGELRGRVVAGGDGVGGAIVFGLRADVPQKVFDLHDHAETDEVAWLSRPLDSLDVHRSEPHCATAADGAFRFLTVGPGPFELRARAATAVAWSAPLRVVLSRADASADVVLELPTAGVRGVFDVSAIALPDRQFVCARLEPLADGAADPSAWMERMAFGRFAPGPAEHHLEQPVRPDGSFEFANLAAGDWLLRILTRSGVIALQRPVAVDGFAVVDVGPLTDAVNVRPNLTINATDVGLELYALFGEHEAFVRKPGFAADRYDLGSVAPGRYRLRASRWTYDSSGNVEFGPCGAPFDFDVAADGRCSPAVAWPDGLK